MENEIEIFIGTNDMEQAVEIATSDLPAKAVFVLPESNGYRLWAEL
jgi:hypothetical protein